MSVRTPMMRQGPSSASQVLSPPSHLTQNQSPDCLWLLLSLSILKPCSDVRERTGTHVLCSLPAGPPSASMHNPGHFDFWPHFLLRPSPPKYCWFHHSTPVTSPVPPGRIAHPHPAHTLTNCSFTKTHTGIIIMRPRHLAPARVLTDAQDP